MPHFYSGDVVEAALAMLRAGSRICAVSRELGVPWKTVARWRTEYIVKGNDRGQPNCAVPCPRCEGTPLDAPAYAELLGWYLGDGHIVASGTNRIWKLSIYNDLQYTGDNAQLIELMRRVKPGGRPCTQERPEMLATYMYWKHWTCLFPQHGPGYKHSRPIALDDWQRAIVEAHPDRFLRGLFHSDGCRAANWTHKVVAGELKRYDYPRWQFSNRSADIRALCCWALDLLEIPWRHSQTWTISVSRREAVARLDALIGLKQ